MATKSASDILTVHNIDVDCNDSQVEWKRKIISGIDEDGNHFSQDEDVPYGFDHSKGFQTMYEGQIYAIRPGDSRRLPRYIAEKFAKELIDHLLSKKSILMKDPNMVNNVDERTQLLEQIIVAEDILIQEDGFATPQQDNFGVVDTKDSKVLKEDEVEVGDALRGFKVEKQDTITLEDIKNAAHETITDGEVVRTRVELMTECKTLGLPVKRTDTTRDLLNRIKAFAAV